MIKKLNSVCIHGIFFALLFGFFVPLAPSADFVLSAENLFFTPLSVAVNPNTQEIFVLNQGANNITILDQKTNKPLNAILLSAKISNLRKAKIKINTKTGEIFVVSPPEDKVVIFSPPETEDGVYSLAAEIKVGRYPFSFVIDESANKIYVASHLDKNVSVIEGKDKKISSVIEIGGGPTDLALNKAKNEIYACDQTNGRIIVIDTAKNQITNSIKVSLKPTKIIYADSVKRIFAIDRMENAVSILDANNKKVISAIKTDTSPVDLVFNKNTNKLYIANAESGNLTTYNLITAQKKKLQLDPGFFPERLAIDEERNKIFVSADGANQVLVIDGQTDQIIKTFDIGGQVSEIVFDSKSGKLYGANQELNNLFIIDAKNDSYEIIGATTALSEVAGKRIIYGPAVLLARSLDQNGKQSSVLFVANVLNQTISVFDSNLRLKKQIPVNFTFPGGYFEIFTKSVVFAGTNKVLIFNRILDEFKIREVDIEGASKNIVAVDSLNKFFVVTSEGKFYSINLKDASISASLQFDFSPSDMVFDSRDNKIYIASFENDILAAVDPLTNSIVKEISVIKPLSLRVNPAQSRLYVNSYAEKKVLAFDSQTFQIVKEWQLDSSPNYSVLDSDENKIFVGHRGGGGVSIVDLATNEIRNLRDIERPSAVSSVFTEPSRFYVLDKINNAIGVIDAKEEKFIKIAKTGASPNFVAVQKNNGQVYVANIWGNSISVFDKNLALMATILSDGSVVWAQGKEPTVAKENIIGKMWQWITGHKKESGAILIGIILLVLGFLFWQKRIKIKEIKPGL